MALEEMLITFPPSPQARKMCNSSPFEMEKWEVTRPSLPLVLEEVGHCGSPSNLVQRGFAPTPDYWEQWAPWALVSRDLSRGQPRPFTSQLEQWDSQVRTTVEGGMQRGEGARLAGDRLSLGTPEWQCPAVLQGWEATH